MVSLCIKKANINKQSKKEMVVLMNRINLMRHGKSVGNEQGIIQGLCDFSLSNQGKIDLKNCDYTNLSNVKKIYSSSLKRAIDTAEIV